MEKAGSALKDGGMLCAICDCLEDLAPEKAESRHSTAQEEAAGTY